MRDPYDILGVKRGASLDEVKAAYRRACKERHPDLGGSHEAMVELNTAYAFILNELKHGYQQQQEEEQARTERRSGRGGLARCRRRRRATTSATIVGATSIATSTKSSKTMRRAAEQYDEQLRTMRRAAWQTGHRARLGETHLGRSSRLPQTDGAQRHQRASRFSSPRLVGVGSVLVEANFVSALILLGSGIGFAFSLALKSDKGGMLSAAFLLFGIMTIWLPPVRGALVLYPAGDDMRADSARADFQIRAGRRHGRLDDRRRARALCHRRDRQRHDARATERRNRSAANTAVLAGTHSDTSRATETYSRAVAFDCARRAERRTAAARRAARPHSSRAPDAPRRRRRDPQIRCRRPVPPESANRPIDLATSDPRHREARLGRGRKRRLRRIP